MMITVQSVLRIRPNLSTRIVRNSVERFPGICFTEIKNFTGLSTGSTSYAIRQLKRLGFISERIFGGNTRYFEPSIPESEKKAICALRNKSTIRILEIMLNNKRVTAKIIHQTIGISYPTVSWHLRRLLEHGIVTKLTDGSYIINSRRDMIMAMRRHEASLVDKLANNLGSMWEV